LRDPSNPLSRRAARPALGQSIVDAIGNTPMIELSRILDGREGRLLAKLDYLNPGLSRKDRIARAMLEAAIADGELEPGQTVVELTSGNTGTGLALVCAVLGYPFVAVMSEGNSPERARMMRALGAEVVLVPQAGESEVGRVTGDDLALVEERARVLTAERQAFRADQFSRRANRMAHQLHTGPEMWQQSAGQIDAFCDFVGTGGTYAGVTVALKSRRPKIRCYVLEPVRSAVIAGNPIVSQQHQIQGGGYAMAHLEMLRDVPVDGYLTVTDDDAIATARALARREGVFAGFSSGAVVQAALDLLEGPHRGQTIAVVLADSGLKYLSTGLWPD